MSVPKKGHLSVGEVTSMIEVRAYLAHFDLPLVLEQCDVALGAGAAAVLCRPEHVPAVAEALAGSSTKVGTALGLSAAPSRFPSPERHLAEVATACEEGATQVAITASAQRLSPQGLPHLVSEIRKIAELTVPARVELKVALMSAPSWGSDLRAVCRHVVGAGADIVQAGFMDERTPLSELGTMKDAIGPDVRLKWSHPVRSLDRLLLAHAEGVDLFNADITCIKAEAEHRSQWGGIRVPVPGRDYLELSRARRAPTTPQRAGLTRP